MESQVQNNNKNLNEAFQKKYIKRYKNYARFHFTHTSREWECTKPGFGQILW